MEMMATKREAGYRAVEGLIEWSVMGMPVTLAETVTKALHGIASCGDCRSASEDWVLFGEVMDVNIGPNLCAHIRRTSMLMQPLDAENVRWPAFDILCPVRHCRLDLAPGMWIGILAKPENRLDGERILADAKVTVWNIPSYNSSLAWQVSHLFAGAYEGWLRAMWWLQNAGMGYVFASHTSVDWSSDVMRTWSMNHRKDFLRCPLEVDFDSSDAYTGILADVNEITLVRATSHKSNLLMTLSPPCPSWSKGGKHSGLASDEGFCFLDAIDHVCKVRPVLALFECSDGLESHPHWRVISAAMQLAGYMRIWSQDVAIHQMTSNQRTRWLAVWCRQDVGGHKSAERLQCSIPRRIPWNDPKHLFELPSTLANSLKLSQAQLQIYGDRNLLPPAKKVRVIEGASLQQVLQQRVLQTGEYLPTLCASYTAQHLLQAEHAQNKGIFATLISVNDEFHFIDPFVFASLFGTTATLSLPSDIRTAFHQLGNAISQIHALAAILFALEGVSGEAISKLAILQQCWDDRLTAENAVVRAVDGMYVLQPIADVVTKILPSIRTWQPWLAGNVLIRFCDDCTLIPLEKKVDGMVISDLLHGLELENHHRRLLTLLWDGQVLPHDMAWGQIPSGQIALRCGAFEIVSMQALKIGENLGSDDPIVSPTQPWCEQEDDPEFDFLLEAHRKGFLHVAEYVCQDVQPRAVARVLMLQQDGTFSWINQANVDRLGSIPSFQSLDMHLHFIKANHEACRTLIGVLVVLAIQGTYEPVSASKWVLLAGGQDTKWLKICQVPRTMTPMQCSALLEQPCTIKLRNSVECPANQPLMLINGDILWCDSKPRQAVPIAFGGMDSLTEHPSCNVQNDSVAARLLQFNLEPGALAIDEMVFHFDVLQLLMPSICWCAPAMWVSSESQFRFPVEPADLQRCFQHFVVPILVVFDWLFVEVRFFEGQWRVLYHSPEQLTLRQRTAVLELINNMRIPVQPNAFRWIRTTEDSELAAWHTLRTFYARAGAPLLPTSHRTTQRLQRAQYTDHVMQILDQADFVWRDTQTDDRMLQFARASRNAFMVAILESPSRAEDLILRSTGRPPQVYNIHEIFFVADEWLDMRANIYRTHPGWATSDEMEFLLTFFLPESFCPPVLHHDLSIIAASVMPRSDQFQRFVALREGHWVGIEVICNAEEHTCRVVFLQAPARDQQFWTNFAAEYVVPIGFRPIIIVDTTRTRPGMCGWELLHRWVVSDLSLPADFHFPQQKRQVVDMILEESERAWRTAGAPPMLRTFAANVRRTFLLVGGCQALQPCSAVSLGGMEGAAPPDTPMQAADPWQFDDPWKTKKKTVKQSKWEDLQLQTDHPFVSKDKVPLPFVQKQQLSTNRGGIAFVSKGNLKQATEIVPKEPCALLLPIIDPTDPLAKMPNLSGPFEVIVFDPALNQEYKRQVHLVIVTPEVQFLLPTPSITLTLAAVCEIVLECDARLTTKDVFQSFYDNPLGKFKVLLKEVCSDPIWNHAAIYGYRVIQEHAKDKRDVVHQCLLKVQQKHRTPLLAASGTGDLVARDFIPKGEQVDDLSIIPRFWPIDRANKADLIKAASSITGYRGIAVTKRGLAPRFATDALATARDLLLPQDDRICTINKAMVPKVNMDSLGWPAEILAKDIVAAVHQTTKVPCIPTRSFRRAGVCAWTLSFEKAPSVTKFSVRVNDKTFEILLTPASYKISPKGKGKGKSFKGGQVQAKEQPASRGAVSKEIHHERIDRLEEQVGRLEQRHESLSEKVDSQFNQVGDQLRQILQCVQPRHRDQGDTPPPVKHHRAA